MSIVQSVEGCLEAAIGPHGLTEAELRSWLGKLEPAIGGLRAQYESGALPLLRVPERTDDIAPAEAALARLGRDAGTIVFFGTGGSSLGGQTLAQFGGWYIPGEHKAGQMRRPRTRFYDNLDPRTLDRTLQGLDPERTRFVVISKSGNTPETLVQFLAALQAVQARGLGDRVPDLFLGLTDPAVAGRSNGVREICAAHGIPLLDHDPGVGGRFTALTNVGLLAALARGLDVAALRAGGKACVDALLACDGPGDYAPALGAAVAVGLAKARGVRTLVMMPYTDRLGRFAHWYVQLWAESLGKGGEGTTPVPALGPVDQHSQLQLYLDGPRDHMITVIRQDAAGEGPRIDAGLARQAGADYLAGRTAGDLVAAQQRAIPDALIAAGRPVRTIDIHDLDERALGGLMMHCMIETILAAHLLGVDAFGQPAVEAGKELTRRHLRQRPDASKEKQGGRPSTATVGR